MELVQAAAVSTGEEMPADLQDWEWILEQPNRYQWLVTMMEDPDAAITFFSTNCMDEVVQRTESLLLLVWLDSDELDKFDVSSGGRMLQCVDNAGALSDAARCEFPLPLPITDGALVSDDHPSKVPDVKHCPPPCCSLLAQVLYVCCSAPRFSSLL